MPLPERYAREVPKMVKIWEPAGYFDAQSRIWLAQSEARHELYGKPTAEQLKEIRAALALNPEDVDALNEAKGHETNKLLRKVQGKLSPEAGNFIHLGNTSSDVLDTSLSLQIIESLGVIKSDFDKLGESLASLALKHRGTLQVARTHTQHGIPQTFGRQVLGWYEEVQRGIERTARAKQTISFGKTSGEVGTNVFIEPEVEELALSKLGLKPDSAPTQIISRDRHAEVVALMAVNGTTLARIATNIRLLGSTDIGEVREPFDPETQQGSSAMPHKRNTELTERVVGLNRRIRSTVGEELDAAITWLERDISHSSTERLTLPDLFGCLSYIAKLTTFVTDGLVVNADTMLKNMDKTHGSIYSSRLLNALLETGQISRTEAYELVKGLSQTAMDTETPLLKLASDNPTIAKLLKPDQLPELFDPGFYLRNIDVAFKRAGLIFSKDKK
ncbi:MAG: adenylosuccinate lyase [Candidatus Levybacteria bacterium]|nr:adenylosuccinate lyase [Candidatus Levybacteria bacterium]